MTICTVWPETKGFFRPGMFVMFPGLLEFSTPLRVLVHADGVLLYPVREFLLAAVWDTVWMYRAKHWFFSLAMKAEISIFCPWRIVKWWVHLCQNRANLKERWSKFVFYKFNSYKLYVFLQRSKFRFWLIFNHYPVDRQYHLNYEVYYIGTYFIMIGFACKFSFLRRKNEKCGQVLPKSFFRYQ